MKETVFEAGGLLRGSSAPALESFLRRHPGIHQVEANYMSDTATVMYDEGAVSEAEIRRLIEDCGYHCRGEALPRHICEPNLKKKRSLRRRRGWRTRWAMHPGKAWKGWLVMYETAFL